MPDTNVPDPRAGLTFAPNVGTWLSVRSGSAVADSAETDMHPVLRSVALASIDSGVKQRSKGTS